MKRKRFSEEQFISVLKENEAGAKIDDLCRRHGISTATFYTWRTKYSGMEACETKRLWALESENAKPKRIVADQMLDTSAMKRAARKNVWSAPRLQVVWRGSGLRKCIRPLVSELVLPATP